MTKNELNIALSAVLATALETEPLPFVESLAYMALGSDMGKWTVVKIILVEGDLATCEGGVIELTPKGREIARQCNAALASA